MPLTTRNLRNFNSTDCYYGREDHSAREAVHEEGFREHPEDGQASCQASRVAAAERSSAAGHIRCHGGES